MDHFDDLIILSERKEAYIGLCRCCHTINFVYRNLAIQFTDEEFIYFKSYFDRLNTDDYIFESRIGKNVFMASPTKNIVYCFSKEEIELLKDLMNEASLMIEVYVILSVIRRKE
jgi:hypothetical protein